MTADSLARALEARRSGSSCWMAKCPAHDDNNPSLSIRELDGKVLVHCHSGCAQRNVIHALKARGLWQSERSKNPRIVATYDYTDENGNLLYQVVRYQPTDFRQRRPDGCGGWIWKKGARQVLYHLREVLEAPIVFVVEGEKDCESLRAAGFVATTNAGGAKAPWLPQFTEALRNREVILIPDNDEPDGGACLPLGARCKARRRGSSFGSRRTRRISAIGLRVVIARLSLSRKLRERREINEERNQGTVRHGCYRSRAADTAGIRRAGRVRRGVSLVPTRRYAGRLL
jgi:hypothetical protein